MGAYQAHQMPFPTRQKYVPGISLEAGVCFQPTGADVGQEEEGLDTVQSIFESKLVVLYRFRMPRRQSQGQM